MLGLKRITGNPLLDNIIRGASSLLVFGSAGSGKTTLLLTIASNICHSPHTCLYISTEETLHYERVARQPDKYSNVLFTEIYDYDELEDLVLYRLGLMDINIVFIDSINSLYRLIAYSEESITRYGLLLAMLWMNSVGRNGLLYASAQVRMGFEEDEEEVVASGMNILNYWFDIILYLGWINSKRAARIEKPREYSDKVFFFDITDKGIEWISNE
jgi:DNA repair protein RadB